MSVLQKYSFLFFWEAGEFLEVLFNTQKYPLQK